jgi:hypothetical protein
MALKDRKLIKVLICGDRNYKEEYAPVVNRVVRGLARKYGARDLLIIEGGAPGIDTMVKVAAVKVNIHVAEINALWGTRRNGAGPQRNEIMALLQPIEVIGIHDDIEHSRGTKHMLETADSLGIPTRIAHPPKEAASRGISRRLGERAATD